MASTTANFSAAYYLGGGGEEASYIYVSMFAQR